MNKENLIIKLIEMLIGGDVSPPKTTLQNHLIDEWVIVRCRDAGVHFGKLKSYEGREVVLEESRRMWYWVAEKGHTLSGCAIHGIKKSSKIAGKIDKIILLEACEIIKCSKSSADSIGGADEYQPN